MNTFLNETLQVNFTEANINLYFETVIRVSNTSPEFFLKAVEEFLDIERDVDDDDPVIVDSSKIRVSLISFNR